MKGFSARTFASPGAPLHAAAHSHHPWPDASFIAQQTAWDDAARLLDRKWAHVFENVIPAAQKHVARILNLPDPATVAFGPNTHGFVVRLLSCFPSHRPVRILTTSSEFMSFSRQITRLEEEGHARVTRVACEPFETFESRFVAAAKRESHDLVFFSQVFFDSGYCVHDCAGIVAAVSDPDTFIVIDGYHAFMAVPVDIGAMAQRVFYLAGGYKYAMAGEGCCFLHCPPGYGARPRDTGWYAGFSALEGSGAAVAYAQDASRFLGATFDVTALYRFNAVQEWLSFEDHGVATMRAHVRELEHVFLAALASATAPVDGTMLIVPDAARRGRFLAFRTPKAGEITAQLAARNVIVDHRGESLRIGLGIYHERADSLRLAEELGRI